MSKNHFEQVYKMCINLKRTQLATILHVAQWLLRTSDADGREFRLFSIKLFWNLFTFNNSIMPWSIAVQKFVGVFRETTTRATPRRLKHVLTLQLFLIKTACWSKNLGLGVQPFGYKARYQPLFVETSPAGPGPESGWVVPSRLTCLLQPSCEKTRDDWERFSQGCGIRVYSAINVLKIHFTDRRKQDAARMQYLHYNFFLISVLEWFTARNCTFCALITNRQSWWCSIWTRFLGTYWKYFKTRTPRKIKSILLLKH